MNPAIKRLTKAMRGLLPVGLLMHAMRGIAADCGVTVLRGVGNDIQVHRRIHLVLFRRTEYGRCD